MQVREWVSTTGLENLSKKLVNVKEKVEFEKPKMSLDVLLKYGNLLVEEQVRTVPCVCKPYNSADRSRCCCRYAHLSGKAMSVLAHCTSFGHLLLACMALFNAEKTEGSP
jgi:hypothetical protein